MISLSTRSNVLVAALAAAIGWAAPAAAQPAPPPAPPTAPAAAQPASAPATAASVDELRAQLKAEREAAEKRFAEQARAIAELRASQQASEERRAADLAQVRAVEDELRSATAHRPLVQTRNFGLTLSGFVQADGVFYNQASVDELDPSTGEPLNETRFLLRRARPRVDADYKFIFGAFEIDANPVRGPQVRPISFEAGVRYKNPSSEIPYIALHLGMVRTPFGFEVQQSDRDRLFLERATMATAFFPGEYDLGIRAFGGWRFLRYVVAAMNGDPVGERLFPGRDPNQSKDFVGRVGVDLGFLRRVRLAGGFSALYGQGFRKGVPAGKDTTLWRDLNQNGSIDAGELQALPGQAGQPSASFSRYALGGDAQLAIQLPRVGALTLMGEVIYGVNLDRAIQISDPIGAGRDLRALGWYAGFTQELTRWAMVGFRYDEYNPDRDSTLLNNGKIIPRNAKISTMTAAVAARLAGYGRVILEYRHETNALGRKLDGTPTTLGADVLTLRGEVTF
jgi:hypothetical protein